MDLLETVYSSLEAATIVLALVTTRVAIIVQMVPFFGGKGTPQPIKVAIAIALSLVLFPTAFAQYVSSPPSHLLLGALALKEALVGLTLGLVTALSFDAVRIAGQIMDTTRGQNLATALVPQLPDRVSVTAVLLYELAVVMFMLTGGHLIFYAALLASFQTFPLFEIPTISEPMMFWILRRFGDCMIFAVQLALPTMAALLLADMVLALVNKAAPQIQVFFLGMPAKAMLGLFVVFLSLATLETFWVDTAIEETQDLQHILELEQ